LPLIIISTISFAPFQAYAPKRAPLPKKWDGLIKQIGLCLKNMNFVIVDSKKPTNFYKQEISRRYDSLSLFPSSPFRYTTPRKPAVDPSFLETPKHSIVDAKASAPPLEEFSDSAYFAPPRDIKVDPKASAPDVNYLDESPF